MAGFALSLFCGVFFIIVLFCPRGAASADDANTARFRLRKANQQEALRCGMPNDDLAEFSCGVPLVRENPRQRIAEYRDRLGKAHVVLAVVGSGFARVLCEYQRHRVSLQNNEIVGHRTVSKQMPDKDVRLSRGRIRWEAHLISGAKACSTSFCRLEFCQSPGFHTARRPMSRFSTVGASASHSFGARCLKKVNFWPTGDNLWRSCIVFTVEATPQL